MTRDLICIPRPARGQVFAEAGCYRKDAESLAVAYHAYHSAVQRGDYHNAVAWGERLLECCEATGADLAGHVRQCLPHFRALADTQPQLDASRDLAAGKAG